MQTRLDLHAIELNEEFPRVETAATLFQEYCYEYRKDFSFLSRVISGLEFSIRETFKNLDKEITSLLVFYAVDGMKSTADRFVLSGHGDPDVRTKLNRQ